MSTGLRNRWRSAAQGDHRLSGCPPEPAHGSISEVATAYHDARLYVRTVSVVNSLVDVVRGETDVSARSVAAELYECGEDPNG
jgi:hypothetical protein